ncbi:MAG: glycoside hydrolase family 78 protein [Caldilineaceae bacterium]|nr:glycoside hydrolase family 78 protein [Caldilineaceae bacterium]
MSEVAVSSIKVEHLSEPTGIGFDRPRLSWQVETDIPNWRQSAYEIACCDADGDQTGRVESDQSVLVDWPFTSLPSRRRVSVKVRVWGADGSESLWSEPAFIEAGFLHVDDWSARFITPAWDEDTSQPNPAPYLRREFELGDAIQSARLYVTAFGVYEAYINGRPVGDQVLAPGWTVYDRRLRYQTFDVTDLLQSGANVVGAIVGDGWYRGRFGFGGGRMNIYGDKPALLAQLEVTYADGTTERIVTDADWRAATGPIRVSSIYDGETYDARLEMDGWAVPGFDASAWSDVGILPRDLAILTAPVGPPVRRMAEFAPVSIIQSPSGKTLADFGRNLVGRLRITVEGEAGRTITLRHAEVLEEGELGTRPLRTAEAVDRYTLRGGGVEEYEPYFTFHGFRYVEIENWPGELRADNLTAVVLYSDMERTGWFECSDPLLNQLHENVIWSMRGNFLDVPTDCPQRDERLGWTGDIQIFAPTAAFLYDVSGFLRSWLADLAAEQAKLDGAVPHIVPDILGDGAAAAWADAAVIVPWVLYQRYDDPLILADQFESMCDWVDYMVQAAGDNFLWDIGFQFGDWLDPAAPPDKPWEARTDKAVVAGAYFVHSAALTARTAAILGRTADEVRYAEVAANAKAAFIREYITPAGRMMSDTETAYALAIAFDLLPTDEQRRRAGDRLATLVRDGGYRIRTGFVGTPLICDALCDTGHYETAYRLLTQRECPSWLYPVTMGATTIWERWDSMLPDGSINPGEMTSFNHYALGAVADWMQRTICGLAPDAPGYGRIAIKPRPGGGITQAEVRHLTPYGPAECAWRIENGRIHMSVVIPPNTTALVSLPGNDGSPLEVGSGTWSWSADYAASDARGPYTVDDLVSEIMSEPAAREAVMIGLERLGAPHFLQIILANEGGMPLRQALRMLPDEAGAAELLNEELAEAGSSV